MTKKKTAEPLSSETIKAHDILVCCIKKEKIPPSVGFRACVEMVVAFAIKSKTPRKIFDLMIEKVFERLGDSDD